ncbi:MAG: TonB family protein [Pseudomonadota bacterium]
MQFKRVMSAAAVGILVAVSPLAVPLAAKVTQNEALATGKVTALKPISDWNLDYGAGRCRLARLFGSNEDRHLLFFDQAAPDDSFGVTLAGSQASNFSRPGRTYVGFDPETELRRLERLGSGDVPGYGPAIILTAYTIAPSAAERASAPTPEHVSAGIDPRALANSDRVTFMSGKRVLSLETGNMMAPIEALNACTDDLINDWGLDPEKHRSYRPAKMRNLRAFTKSIQANYPRKALVKGQSGIVRMRVTVEADGSASDCALEKTTKAESLNSPACKTAMRFAKFDPALDRDGQPMRSFYATNITYSAQ